jgi:S-methylmethionine-dependent homocysteine/selenocysteine methylase
MPSKCILGEGAVIERLRRSPDGELDAHIVSFAARPEGTLPDGTPRKDAVAAIDAAAHPPPLAYMANCTHASISRAALRHAVNSSLRVRDRRVGLLANTAARGPEELDDSPGLVEEDPEVFGRSAADLHGESGMKILGGCCGTDNRRFHCLAERLAVRQL